MCVPVLELQFMRPEDKRKDKAAFTMPVSHSSTHACRASFVCGAGHTLTSTALATVLICTTIRQDPLNLHYKIHNYVILYLQVPYQSNFLSSYILKHQETRIALKRHLALLNTCSILPPLPVFTERELSFQLPHGLTSSAVPWLCIQQTWQKPVCWSQPFIAACAYSTCLHKGSPEPSPSLFNAFLHHMVKPQRCLLWDISHHGG